MPRRNDEDDDKKKLSMVTLSRFKLTGDTTVHNLPAYTAEADGRKFIIRSPALQWPDPIERRSQEQTRAYLEVLVGMLFREFTSRVFCPPFFVVRNRTRYLVGWEALPEAAKPWAIENNGNLDFLEKRCQGIPSILFLNALVGTRHLPIQSLFYSENPKSINFHQVDHRGAFRFCLPPDASFDFTLRACTFLGTRLFGDPDQGTYFKLFKHLFSAQKLKNVIAKVDDSIIAEYIKTTPCLKVLKLEKRLLTPLRHLHDELGIL